MIRNVKILKICFLLIAFFVTFNCFSQKSALKPYIDFLQCQNTSAVDYVFELFEKYDIIVSNPPYIRPDVIKTLEPEVREHDPWLALDGGEDGLSFYRILAKEGKKYLNSQGMIFMEIGYDQGQAVKEIFESEGFVDIVIKKDLCKNDRVVIGRII